jgi:hypothetical protein
VLIAHSSGGATIVREMAGLLLFLTSAAVLAGAFVATIVVHGGWEAGAAGIAVVAGVACLTAFVVMITAADGAPRGPRARG